jgi:cathepsin A (carboxypeptidase C)
MKHLFFWMFEKRDSHLLDDQEASEIPFVVWLTGGPGCSSTLALLTENGPCSVNPDGRTTKVNPYSWTEAAHVLWLDQPAGVGFSYGDENDSGEAMVSEDAYFFFQAFFQAHPEYSQSPFYVIGESYAGHYVPAITHRIWKGNKSLCDKCVHINLAGFAIGNGLTNPEEQYKWYPEMVWNNSHGIKIVDESVYDAMKAAVPNCVELIHQCNKGDNALNSFACQTAFVVCNVALTSPYQATGLNPYDISKKCAKPPLCYDFSSVADFLNLESTKQALGVDESHVHNWNACNYGINMKFHTDWMKDFSPYVADLLDAGFPALIYAGDLDFICNYLGNQAWTQGLAWKHSDEFNAAEVHDWNGGTGLARSSNGFTFLQVKDGGHMVPSDQPEVSLTMLKTFLSGGEF